MYTRTLTILATLCALCLIGGCGERAVSPVEPPMAENGTESAGGAGLDATGDEVQETEADAPPAANREDALRAANLVDRGQEALDNGEWPEADEAFLRAVELDPANADA